MHPCHFALKFKAAIEDDSGNKSKVGNAISNVKFCGIARGRVPKLQQPTAERESHATIKSELARVATSFPLENTPLELSSQNRVQFNFVCSARQFLAKGANYIRIYFNPISNYSRWH